MEAIRVPGAPGLDFDVKALLPLVLHGDEDTLCVPRWQVGIMDPIDDLDSEVGPTVSAQQGVAVEITCSPVGLLAEVFLPRVQAGVVDQPLADVGFVQASPSF